MSCTAGYMRCPREMRFAITAPGWLFEVIVNELRRPGSPARSGSWTGCTEPGGRFSVATVFASGLPAEIVLKETVTVAGLRPKLATARSVANFSLLSRSVIPTGTPAKIIDGEFMPALFEKFSEIVACAPAELVGAIPQTANVPLPVLLETSIATGWPKASE